MTIVCSFVGGSGHLVPQLPLLIAPRETGHELTPDQAARLVAGDTCPMTRALLLVDIQLDYFPGGAFPLVAPDAAAAAAAAVLGRFRASEETVVHIFHVSAGADAPFFVPGTPGIDIHPLVAPIDDEIVLEKHQPNSFIDTGLQQLLTDEGVTELVIVGMMSSMCIDSTTRAASELGFEVTVVSDACAAPDLTFGDTVISGETVHASFMAALDGSFATVLTSDALQQ